MINLCRNVTVGLGWGGGDSHTALQLHFIYPHFPHPATFIQRPFPNQIQFGLGNNCVNLGAYMIFVILNRQDFFVNFCSTQNA